MTALYYVIAVGCFLALLLRYLGQCLERSAHRGADWVDRHVLEVERRVAEADRRGKDTTHEVYTGPERRKGPRRAADRT